MSTDKSNEPAALKFGKGEISTVAKYGGIGLLGAIGVGMASVFFSQNSSTTPLLPETESLHHLPDLRSLFVELQDHRAIDEKRFSRAVTRADQYARIYDMIMNKKKLVTDKLLHISYRLLKQCEKNVSEFVISAVKDKRNVPPQKVVEINTLERYIHDSLSKSYLNISNQKKV